jgi:predicted alpha/beta-fold hydrolase
MGERTNQIEAHIESTRDKLGSNLNELQQKVKSITDWRQHFQSNPMTMIGVAFGGGILLATMMAGRRSRRSDRSYFSQPSEPHAGADHLKHQAWRPGTTSKAR